MLPGNLAQRERDRGACLQASKGSSRYLRLAGARLSAPLAEIEASESWELSVLQFVMTMADLVAAVLHLGVRSLLYEASLADNVLQDALDLSGGVIVVREALDEECEGCL